MKKLRFIILIVFLFAIVATGTVFGVQFITKTGIFRIPGVVYYDETLKEDETELLKSIFTEEVDLDKDVKISAVETLEKPTEKEGHFLYEIYVPITDFYSTETSISSEKIYAPETKLIKFSELDSTVKLLSIDGKYFLDEFDSGAVFRSIIFECAWKLISVDELSFNRKLLKINDQYYLDDFKNGAVFRIIKFESELYEKEIEPLVKDTFTKTFPKKETVLTMAQTGVTALSRGMDVKLKSVGMDATYFAQNIGEYLSSFDLTHTSNESSFSDSAWARNICSNPAFVNTLTAIGLDIVELTGNHNRDCGYEAATATIDKYDELGIKTVGGGRNASEAGIPLEISEKGTNITMLAYNHSTGGATYNNLPGANQYYEEDAARNITTAKQKGDIVIVDIQYYECSGYASTYEDATCDYANSSAGDQVGFFRHLIDLGADIVVGTSAHQPQTFERYGDGVIYYGLGNLFFDQIWWPGTTRSLILAHYFYDGKILQTKIVPTFYDENMQTKLMDEETAKWYLERLAKVRP